MGTDPPQPPEAPSLRNILTAERPQANHPNRPSLIDARPFWLRPPALTVLWLLLIIYGSLIPFNFNFAPLLESHNITAALTSLLLAPSWTPATGETSSLGLPPWLTDLGLNLVLYLPLGLLVRLTLSRRIKQPLLQILASGIIIFATSYLIECTQALLPGRVPSLNDVLANAIPSCFAAALALWLRQSKNKIIFFSYTKIINLQRALQSKLPTFRTHPIITSFTAIALISSTIITHLYFKTKSAIAPHTRTESDKLINLIPFSKQFNRSYDVAAAMISSSMIVYALISLLIMLILLHRTSKHTRITLLFIALFAVLLQTLLTISAGQTADITELILAVGSGILLIGLTHFISHTIRASCRRKQGIPVTHDRRNRAHVYHA
ncbi:VanZ family protein [Poriferisphaera sp. WC338]|uniref:VanZ family protein n=1 Tax=Poriferisphaera sp. WC338 TaxID=3425129 RepID=UPI003D81619A